MSSETNITPFLKMHGLGNDFVVIDARTRAFDVTALRASAIADRRRGIGCDQFIVLRSSENADVFMEIWNADGSRVGACGNATRCVGKLLLEETEQDVVSIETDAGLLRAETAPNGISVNMGPARLAWNDIPLSTETDTNAVDLTIGPLSNPCCVNMGNPHAIFFVEDAEAVPLTELGPQIENHPLFPERVNVSVVSLTAGILRQRVWERGAGITEACGSGACAAVVAATRRGLVDHSATIMMDGGLLDMEWLPDGTVQMAGPAELVFSGEFILNDGAGL